MAEGGTQRKGRAVPRSKLLRVPIKVRTADGKVNLSFDDYVLEVDKERIYIKTEEPLPVGSKVHIAMDIPGSKRTIYLRGEVLRINVAKPSSPEGLDPGMGIVLDHVSWDDRRLINAFLDIVQQSEQNNEYATFINWVQKMSQPMTPKERDRVKKDLLKAIYGSGKARLPIPSAARRKSRDDLELMSKIPLFKDLDEQELEEVARLAIKGHITVGNTVFEEGDDGDKMYIILQGKADVIKSVGGKKTQVLVTLGPGEYFGEMSLIDDQPRSAAVMALEDLTTLSISKQDLGHLMEVSSTIAAKLYKFFVQVLTKRLRETNTRIQAFVDMAEKLGSR